MKMEKDMNEDHPIDRFFRSGLKEPDIPFDERDWKALSKKMQNDGSNNPSKTIWISGMLTLFLLITAGVYLNRIIEKKETRETVRDDVGNVPKTEGAYSQDASQPQVVFSENNTEIVQIDRIPHTEIPPDRRATTDPKEFISVDENIDQSLPRTRNLTSESIVKTNLSLEPISISREIKPLHPTMPTVAVAYATTAIEKPNRRKEGSIVSLVTAPDLSGDRALKGQLSGNLGITLSLPLYNRWSFTGGLIYTRKNYNTPFYNYQSSEGWTGYGSLPSRVDAICKVLDIPILLNYKLIDRERHAWLLSGGLSSYIMLNEDYTFTYEDPGKYPYHYNLRNENRHFLSVFHLGVSYRKRIGKHWGVSVQPFMKVPFRGVGEGQIKLYSTGVSFSVDLYPSTR